MERVPQKVRKTFRVHCARGSTCPKCKALKDLGPVFEVRKNQKPSIFLNVVLFIKLIEPDENPNQAARMIEQFSSNDGKKFFQEFRTVRTFASEDEAKAYAIEHKIKDVDM